MQFDIDECYETYERHAPAYDYIQNRLDQLQQGIRDAPDVVGQQLLFLADTYALITSNTAVEAHDLAFAGIAQQPTDADHVAAQLKPENTRARIGNQVVLYYNNKAEYIRHNLRTVEYDKQYQLFCDGQYDALHEMKVDQVKGISETKAAFSLAMSGVTDKACLDSNMVDAFEIDTNLELVDVDEYDQLVADAMAATGQLGEELSPFLWQWVVWDHWRDSAVTTHDSWFLGAESALQGGGVAV